MIPERTPTGSDIPVPGLTETPTQEGTRQMPRIFEVGLKCGELINPAAHLWQFRCGISRRILALP